MGETVCSTAPPHSAGPPSGPLLRPVSKGAADKTKPPQITTPADDKRWENGRVVAWSDWSSLSKHQPPIPRSKLSFDAFCGELRPDRFSSARWPAGRAGQSLPSLPSLFVPHHKENAKSGRRRSRNTFRTKKSLGFPLLPPLIMMISVHFPRATNSNKCIRRGCRTAARLDECRSFSQRGSANQLMGGRVWKKLAFAGFSTKTLAVLGTAQEHIE